jgi:hypothetical protein
MARLRKIQMMTGWGGGRRGLRAPVPLLAVAVAVVTTAALTGAFTGAPGASGAPGPPLSRQQVAQHILKTEAARVMTAPAQAALQMLATGSKQLSAGLPSNGLPGQGQQTFGAASAGAALPQAAFSNVRVNDPSLDTHQMDQTTQSETSIAVAGPHVAVGYNDSQQTGLFFTSASDTSGYSYSADGGATFTDGGTIPNTPEFVNLGDPWLTSTRAGAMYYSTLAFDVFNFNLDVAVAKSADGGKTWGTPVPVYRPPFSVFYFADKPAIASGRDPVVKPRDDLYAAWDDFSITFSPFRFFTGLPVAHSTDGGKTWHLAYAKRFNLTHVRGCSFQQFIGATPTVNPADGTLYVVAEKLAVTDPKCTFTAPVQRSEWIFRSTNGGRTFSPGVKIASVTEAVPNSQAFGPLLFLGAGRYMRDLELPTIALRSSAIYVAWNDGALGKSHIRLATSTDGGQTWATSFVTHGVLDQVQPALSADSSGIHLLYYQRNANLTLDVLAGNSKNGRGFPTKRVTTQSFRGTLTVPQFDPIIAFGYMGDYIANVSDGSHQYFAWGDNRDRVTDFLYPSGRNDPDVFFAKQ